METNKSNLSKQIQSIRQELIDLDIKRMALAKELNLLENDHDSLIKEVEISSSTVSIESHHDLKIKLFMDLFKGRSDVFAKRFESLKSGKSGYQPACENEWITGICEKPRIKCANCDHRIFTRITNDVIRDHLLGYSLEDKRQRNFTVGVYPLLPNETCHFLAVDFDGSNWQTDILAYLHTCREYSIPAVMERSRSGNMSSVKTCSTYMRSSSSLSHILI